MGRIAVGCVARAVLTWSIALLTVMSVLTRPALSDKPVFPTSDSILRFINGYRMEPEPDKLPAFVKALARLGLLRDDQRSGLYFGFVAGVLADNQTRARQLAEQMFPLPPEHQIIVIRSLAYSGLPGWKADLGALAERMPARKRLISKYLFGKGQTLEQMSFKDGPQVLDAWWGFYFATGSYYAISKIVPALKWADEDDDVEQLTVGSMAKWTLASNASRDQHLLDYLRREQSHQPKPVQAHLRQVVVAAENFEVAELRRKTVASIETLKTNGPTKWRKWAWWGRAGQLALTAGCVAASALGQIEFGIPCVIGGVASSGLLKLLELGQTKPE